MLPSFPLSSRTVYCGHPVPFWLSVGGLCVALGVCVWRGAGNLSFYFIGLWIRGAAFAPDTYQKILDLQAHTGS